MTNAQADTAQTTAAWSIGAPTGAEPPCRLRRLDKHDWVIERRQPKGKWVTESYFPKLEQAARALFDRLMLEGEDVLDIDALRSDVERAKQFVAQAAREACT